MLNQDYGSEVVRQLIREQEARKRLEMLIEYTIGTLLDPPDKRPYYWGYVSRLEVNKAEITSTRGKEMIGLNGFRGLELNHIVLLHDKGVAQPFQNKYYPEK